MMKSLISATALSFALTASAFAADLPYREAPPYIPPPPPPLWTGFYAGLNAGYAWDADGGVSSSGTGTALAQIPGAPFPNSALNDQAASLAALTGTAATKASGFIGGGQAGYNYQFNPNIVVGLELDIQGSGVRGSGPFSSGVGTGTVPIGPPFPVENTVFGVGQSQKTLDWFGTVRGRIGYLFMPTVLVYATGGLAYGGVTANSSISPIYVPGVGAFGAPPPPITSGGVSGRNSDTRVGWTVGAGLEWMITQNLSAKVEYLYYDLGSATWSNSPALMTKGPFQDQLFTSSQSSTRFDGHIVRVGLNYHFNWGAPAAVLAKY